MDNSSILAGGREQARTQICFDEYCFDREAGLLRHNGGVVAVQPRVLRVLECLLERPGHVVSRQSLMERVWADTSVTEHSLTESVSVLRRCLTNGHPGSRYIETVHRRGYRFRAFLVERPKALEAESIGSIDSRARFGPRVSRVSSRLAGPLLSLLLSRATRAVFLFRVFTPAVALAVAVPSGPGPAHTVATRANQPKVGEATLRLAGVAVAGLPADIRRTMELRSTL